MIRAATFKSPFLLGFEHLEKLVERNTRKAGDGYPPYNVEVADDAMHIALAVAGFARAELRVVVSGNELTVRGNRGQPDGGNFVHRGIAARPFERSFVLADGVEVRGAQLEHGMLRIDLVRRTLETAPRTIEIK
jgi:HSP20 family molecular chaperone IbpA